MSIATVASPAIKLLFERVGRPKVLNLPDVLRRGGAGAVIVCNHAGWADSLWISYAVYPRPLRHMSKRELFSSPIAKWVMEHAGSIQIDRADPSPSPIKFAVELLRAGELLLIFPAGMRVFVSQQKRGVTPAIKRELKRRSAVEPVIGHLKSDHRMDRNFLIGSEGDAANAVLAAVG